MDLVREAVITARKHLSVIANLIVVIGVPIALLPLVLLVEGQEARCAYVIVVMAVFWMTDVLPIGVTSLIPVFLFPMLGVMGAKAVSATYLNDTSMLFVGGLVFACAVERWNMHVRVALRVLQMVGSTPRWLMLGLMGVTWFLSMWMSNTATTAMMLPIVQAVLQQLEATAHAQQSQSKEPADVSSVEIALEENGVKGHVTKSLEIEIVATEDEPKAQSSDVEHSEQMAVETKNRELEGRLRRQRVALLLCIAYSANIGGFATLTGTGPNLVLRGQLEAMQSTSDTASQITFARWMVYAVPLSLLCLLVLWLWLQLLYVRSSCARGCKTEKEQQEDAVAKVIRQKYKALGPMKGAEWMVLVLFCCVVLLWISKDFNDTCGWGCLFNKGTVSDSTPVMLFCMLLFLLPSELPRTFCCRKTGVPLSKPPPLLDWHTVHTKMPWALYFLLGGGFAIAKAAEESGLSKWVGSKLQVLNGLDPYVLLLILCYVVTLLTEVTSNVGLATLILPVVKSLALTLPANPLFLMCPVTIATSLAFCLPVATPPNAIVFAGGDVRVIDMAIAGLALKVLTVPLIVLATVAWGNTFLHLDVLTLNATLAPNITASSTPI